MTELLDILKAEPATDGLTVTEMLVKMDWPDTVFYRQKLLRRLRGEVAAGRAEYAGDRTVTRIDMRKHNVPTYRAKANG